MPEKKIVYTQHGLHSYCNPKWKTYQNLKNFNAELTRKVSESIRSRYCQKRVALNRLRTDLPVYLYRLATINTPGPIRRVKNLWSNEGNFSFTANVKEKLPPWFYYVGLAEYRRNIAEYMPLCPPMILLCCQRNILKDNICVIWHGFLP